MPFPKRFAVEHGFRSGVQRMRKTVQQKRAGFFQICVTVRGIGIIHGGAEQKTAVPDIGFRFVFSRGGGHACYDRIFGKKPVRFIQTQCTETVAVGAGKERFQCVDPVCHTFETEDGDPCVSPAFAVGCGSASGDMRCEVVTEQAERGFKQFIFGDRKLMRGRCQNAERSGNVEIALYRPVCGFTGSVIGEFVSDGTDRLAQKGKKRRHQVQISLFVQHGTPHVVFWLVDLSYAISADFSMRKRK